jgi:toxin HigB-1
VSEALKHRLADLFAAASVSDLIAGRPRELEGNPSGRMALDLCDGYCVVFAANHTKNPVTETGGTDWKRVTRIKILRIGRDHGQHTRISS